MTAAIQTWGLSKCYGETLAVDEVALRVDRGEVYADVLRPRFGGATSKQAQGVWRSDQAGLVGETVFIVQTYATAADLHRYLPEVVSYVRELKRELRQEAMALEVDNQLMLI